MGEVWRNAYVPISPNSSQTSPADLDLNFRVVSSKMSASDDFCVSQWSEVEFACKTSATGEKVHGLSKSPDLISN